MGLLLSSGSRRARLAQFVAAVVLAATAVVAVEAPEPAQAATLPGFQETIAFSGLVNPINVEFSPDGRVFVAEKSGLIKVFDNLTDTTPTVFADLRTQVHNFWDRGLMGLALAPGFPADPWVYVLYARDAAVGGAAPRWGVVDGTSDPCPNPPGATGDGCVISGRLSRLQANGNVMTGSEMVLIDDWCQQYPSHSVGALEFGADGALYVSGGDGASFNFVDYGQDGNPLNPCGDPPTGVGGTQTPPTAEGGALRSQDVRTSSDPTGLDGAVLRLDPATGAARPDNPLAGSPDPNTRRIIAQGLRNPFRFTIRPGTNEVWLGDVGWGDWEEINRLVNPTDAVDNFGWPCYEGDGRQAGYDAANVSLCENLYAAGPGAVVAPAFRYHHNDLVVAGETCSTGSSSIAGVAFGPASGGNYPADYRGALYFADYSRNCIWAVPAGAGGLPDFAQRRTFVAGAAGPVDLEIGPEGDLYYADLNGGTIRHIAYVSENQPPVAVATANPTSGSAPLTVAFNGSGSSDPDGDTLTYAWDFQGDGVDDSSAVAPSFTYTQPGAYNVRLRVTDTGGASSTDTVTVTPGNTPPNASIDGPSVDLRWRVNDEIVFSGHATDAQDGDLPASSLSWALVLMHCPSNCHEHPVQTFSGVAGGSFLAPDHEYPSQLELRLTAVDANGLSTTVTRRLDPQTATLTFQSQPTGLQLAVGASQQATPFTRTVIAGSTNSVSASSPQSLGGQSYTFSSWSDGGAQSHNIVANASATYVANYDATGPVITNVRATRVKTDTATISWDTNVPADSQVEFGTTTAYGRTTARDTSLVLSHSQVLTGLARKTTYHYRVLSRDSAGNLRMSGDFTFRTK